MKVKMTKYKEELILILIVTVTIGIFMFRFGNFASCGDYLAQHSVFPDYFRKMFYKTSKIVPYFAPNIGGGQNVFYFSYYGLFSPLILPSYFLPFVSMNEYLMVVCIICIYASVLILYRWLARRFSKKISLFMSVSYLFAAPVIYQSYNQIMFIDYMVFLILGLLGVDIYYEKRKSKLLIISIFLMIMTSFYFSIGGMVVIFLYELFVYFEKYNNKKIKYIVIDQLKFILRMVISVLMSSILLVPTALTLIGRGTKGKSIKLLDLFIPKISSIRFLYSPYGIGLTSLIVIVLIASLTYKKLHERVLSYGILIILIVPIFGYVLNGGLYIRDKVFIPFLPLLLFEMAYFMKKLKENEMSKKVILISIILTLLFLSASINSINKRIFIVTIMDALAMVSCFFMYHKYKKIEIILCPVIIIMILCNVIINETQHNLSAKNYYKAVNSNGISKECNDLLKSNKYGYKMEKDYFYKDNSNSGDLNRIDTSNQYVTNFYSSTYNKDYYDFRNDVFNVEQPFRNYLMQGVSENPIFLKLMGVKYTVSNKSLKGREVVNKDKNNKIYDNGEVCPLGYGNSNVISEEEYDKLKFPYNQIALLKYSVIKEKHNSTVDSESIKKEIDEKLEKLDFDIPCVGKKKLAIEKCNDGYKISAKDKESVFLKNNNNDNKNRKIVFFQFKVKNYHKNQDVKMIINGCKNKLTGINGVYYNGNNTFSFASYINKDAKNIMVSFGKGKYKIYDIKSYIYEENEDEFKSLCSDSLKITELWKNGRTLKGDILAKENKLFISSIPYDKGFSVLVDGKNIESKSVNKGFLGFDLVKGNHKVIISYKPQGLEYGEIGSAVGLLWLVAVICFERREK